MIAIIPARGGSKGLPGKNIRNLAGKPLICHTVKAALGASSISRVIVSTDDDAIATAAIECGAEVPFKRPKELADDESMVMDAYLYTVDRISENSDTKIDSFVALLPTAPLRLAKDKANVLILSRNEDKLKAVKKEIKDLGFSAEYYVCDLRKLEDKQAAASVGQIELAHQWKQHLKAHKIDIAQILITLEDSEVRRRYLNARKTINTLCRTKVVVINIMAIKKAFSCLFVTLINENEKIERNEIKL